MVSNKETRSSGGSGRTHAGAVSAYPPAPDVGLSLPARIGALRRLNTGLEQIRAAGGPVTMVRVGPKWLVPPFAVVTSPQGAKDVLGGSDGAFDKQSVFFVEARKWLGLNLFSVAHREWLPRRKAYQPLFTKRQVAEYAGAMAGVADGCATAWVRAGRVDLAAETRRLTLRVLGSALFGTDLDEQAEQVGDSLASSAAFVLDRGLRPVRAPAWLPTPARRRFRASRAFVYAIIDEAIAAAHRDPDSAPLLRLFFDIRDPHTGEPLSDTVICRELVTFLFAGHDTTATALAYALWVLGRDTVIQDRVAEEAAALGDRPLRVDDVPELAYTVRVVHETLRVCPPAPALARQAMRDVVVDGFRIPAGTNMVIGTYAMHHDPALWDNPARFDPDRFAPDRPHDRWQFLPFGGGPRTCIGDHFAMLEATLALASIVRRVRIESVEPALPLATPFTMVAAGPVPALVRART
ncbi:cytochrome P450 [Nocardia huaxiensis]|uniref:cytochrome P450 n=1 Tax=Nocardia huaxiensis TaxID=2755382 RepID=UPI001E43D734|nr:cytochrome P450 [Nocardia huaxiensis]UFS97201.1 cytochrome P450 [Nocardia huaxiensis]